MKETCNIIIGLRKQNAVCLRHKIQNHEKHCNHLNMRIGVLLRGNLSSYSILTRIITNISDFEIQISNIKSYSFFDSLLLSHGVLLNK